MIGRGKSSGIVVNWPKGAAVIAASVLFMASSVRADDALSLIASRPQDGARLERPPPDIEMTFSGALALRGHRILITQADGTVAASGEPAAIRNFTSLHLPLFTALPVGRYSVTWSVKADAGSVSSGTFSFLVSAPSN